MAPQTGSSELRTRLILGPAMLLVIGGLYYVDSKWTGGRVSAVVIGLLALGGVAEYVAMMRRAGHAVASGLLLSFTAALCGSAFFFEGWQMVDRELYPLVIGTILLLFPIAVGSLTRERMKQGLEEQGATLLGFVWIAWPLFLAQGLAIRHLPSLLFVLLVCKGGDIGAYLVGRAFGRHKLIPHVSKGKTVEGALGSVLASCAIAVALRGSLIPVEAGVGWYGAIAIGVMLNVAAQIGDLVESLLKRSCDVKDSSGLLPAHGGVLDLVDSLLFSFPAYFLLPREPHVKDTSDDVQIPIKNFDEVRTLLGPLDTNARLMRELHGVNVLVREGSLRLLGKPENVTTVQEIINSGLNAIRQGRGLTTAEIARRIRGEKATPATQSTPGGTQAAKTRASHGAAKPRTNGQRLYAEAMREHDAVLVIGPAGTGKTYLAVAAAIDAVRGGAARRIVLVRPAVEAGEKLGFLPGDFQAKVDPYLRPLHDALHDLLDPSLRVRYLESELIEICPLAYMRGRTLNEAFIILDEAQNTTVPQMMMFLTRLGQNSQMVVTGDPSQVDLAANVQSGLIDAVRRLRGVKGVGVVELGAEDVVRHPVVQSILGAYDEKPVEPIAKD